MEEEWERKRERKRGRELEREWFRSCPVFRTRRALSSSLIPPIPSSFPYLSFPFPHHSLTSPSPFSCLWHLHSRFRTWTRSSLLLPSILPMPVSFSFTPSSNSLEQPQFLHPVLLTQFLPSLSPSSVSFQFRRFHPERVVDLTHSLFQVREQRRREEERKRNPASCWTRTRDEPVLSSWQKSRTVREELCGERKKGASERENKWGRERKRTSEEEREQVRGWQPPFCSSFLSRILFLPGLSSLTEESKGVLSSLLSFPSTLLPIYTPCLVNKSKPDSSDLLVN